MRVQGDSGMSINVHACVRGLVMQFWQDAEQLVVLE
jgi:hypothetical protein